MQYLTRTDSKDVSNKEENNLNKLGLSCAKLSSSWLPAYTASD